MNCNWCNKELIGFFISKRKFRKDLVLCQDCKAKKKIAQDKTKDFFRKIKKIIKKKSNKITFVYEPKSEKGSELIG